MSSNAGCTASWRCRKCQKEAKTADAIDAAGLCEDCASSQKLVATATQEETEESVRMEIDTDLTTTETLDDLDELEKPAPAITVQHKGKEEPQQKPLQPDPGVQPDEEMDCQEELPVAASIKPEAPGEAANDGASDAEARESKMAPTSSVQAQTQGQAQRVGKITRSSLNGARSPTIMKRLRKSTRSTRFKAKLTGRGNGGAAGATNGHNGQGGSAATLPAAHGPGGGGGGKAHGKPSGGGPGGASGARNRRTLFKRPAQKTPRVQACTRFVKSVFYKGSYMQIGDIVSIVDSEQNVYYAQIRGLLVDTYCEKSAFLTWLIPTQDSPDPRDGFDPATYLIGPDEELSRKLSYLEFMMHAPSNYYFDRTTPFPLPDVDEYTTHRSGGFIWTRLPILKRERERERDRERKAAA